MLRTELKKDHCLGPRLYTGYDICVTDLKTIVDTDFILQKVVEIVVWT